MADEHAAPVVATPPLRRRLLDALLVLVIALVVYTTARVGGELLTGSRIEAAISAVGAAFAFSWVVWSILTVAIVVLAAFARADWWWVVLAAMLAWIVGISSFDPRSFLFVVVVGWLLDPVFGCRW